MSPLAAALPIAPFPGTSGNLASLKTTALPPPPPPQPYLSPPFPWTSDSPIKDGFDSALLTLRLSSAAVEREELAAIKQYVLAIQRGLNETQLRVYKVGSPRIATGVCVGGEGGRENAAEMWVVVVCVWWGGGERGWRRGGG